MIHNNQIPFFRNRNDAGIRKDTNNNTHPFSAPNLNTRGIDILPKTRDITNAIKVINSSFPIPTRSKVIFFKANPAIADTASPNRLPIRQKIAKTTNFPPTKSFFDTGIIMEYRVHFELSSKVNVVTIIMLHNIAHTKVYDSTPDAGIRTTANTTRTNSIDFALCPILEGVRNFVSIEI